MAPPKVYDDLSAPLTHEELLRVLSYDAATGIFRWKIKAGRKNVGDVAGTENKRGYLVIRVKDKLTMAHRLAWLYVYGTWPQNEMIDHRNGVRSDNRIANLRECTRSENGGNSKRHVISKTGFKGVYRARKRWCARITPNRTRIHLGVFDTPAEANAAYAKAAIKYFGEFARSA